MLILQSKTAHMYFLTKILLLTSMEHINAKRDKFNENKEQIKNWLHKISHNISKKIANQI